MIRLEKHEELVETMGEALLGRSLVYFDVNERRHLAAAALDALLAAVVEKGIGRNADGFSRLDGWIADGTRPSGLDMDFPALILKLEPTR